MELTGKAAVVSGAGSGIGRAMALALVRNGARVIVADVDAAGGRETVDMAGTSGGIAIFKACDVTRTEDLAATFASAVEHFGRLDVVCNNAGIGGEDLFGDAPGPWERVIDINLTAVIDATRIAVREMRRRQGGIIINTASMGGLLPMPGSPVYAASKAGVVNFTRSLAYLAEETPRIRVNAICPSYVDTPLVRRNGEERMREVSAQVGGILQPDDIAAGVIELCEDESRSGAIMRVTVRGGRDFARDIRP